MADIPMLDKKDIPLICLATDCPDRVTSRNGHIIQAPDGAPFFSRERARWWVKMFSTDIKFFVIRTIAVFGALCLVGGLLCAILRIQTPEFVIAGFSLCLGYLGGVLAPPRNSGGKE